MEEENKWANYTAEDIQVLSGLEAVRRRPGMYIGSTDQKGLHHLVWEIVDNSVDEAMAGFCNLTEVTLLKDGKVRVSDNGRGIPVELHSVTHKSALETVMTTLHSGAKFGGKSYQVAGGLHGVGAHVVNALSSWMRVEVRREGKLHSQEYRRGIPTGPVADGGPAEGSGTTTLFLADEEIFGSTRFNFDTLAQRFREAAYLNPGLEIRFRDEREDREITFYFEGGISSLVSSLNRHRTVLHPHPIPINKTVNGTAVDVALQYDDGYTETTLAFANCIPNEEGGTHLAGFRAALTRALNDYCRRYKFLKEDEANFSGEDLREGLTAVISVKVKEPQFEGQTKTRLGNPEVKGQVEVVVAEGLFSYLEQNPDDARAIIEKCRTTARARDAAKKARELVLKKSSFDISTLPGKLADCTEKDPETREIFIVEGDSAGGSAKMGRDRRFQAILPLKGKILNVEKVSEDKVWNHEEIRALITALGAGIKDVFDLAKLRYHRVIIMTDADVDGSHIRTLLLTFFFRHMKPVIESGYLYIAQPPLYRIQRGKEMFWVYSEKDKEERLAHLGGDRNLTIQRYKGLGEMSAVQLWETTMNPSSRTMLLVSIGDAEGANKTFEQLMGEDVSPRKDFIKAYAKSVRNLDI